MNIGNVIKKYRTLRKMTQEELAGILAVTPQAVSRWENNLSYPDVAMIPKILQVLGCSADELFDTEFYTKPHDAEFAMVPLNVLRHLEYRREDADEDCLDQDQVDCLFGYPAKADDTPKTVLVIDDSAFMRNMVSDILGNKGYRVLQAESGESGLETLRNRADFGNQADVCVIDIRMPGMDGLEVLKQVRGRYPAVRVVMLSAASTRKNVTTARDLGAAAFVAKPFQPNRLMENV